MELRSKTLEMISLNVSLVQQERPFLRTQKNSPTDRALSSSPLVESVRTLIISLNNSIESQHPQLNTTDCAALCFLQSMGTELTCTDRSPSPTTPTTGTTLNLSPLKLIFQAYSCS